MDCMMFVKRSRAYKIFILTLFPFLMAFLVGNTLVAISFLFYDGSMLGWFNDERLLSLDDIANSLFIWGFFYLSIMTVFTREEWLDRFYQFSKPLILTVPFGVVLLVSSFYGIGGHKGLMKVAYITGLFSWLLLIFVFIPLTFIETIWLGVLIKKNKGYGWLKSQCISFFMFLFLPLFLTRIVNWLFRIIF